MDAGGKTQMASLINAALIILTLMFLLPLFTNLAHSALAAIVIYAMIGLLKPGYLIQLWKQSPLEFSIGMVAYFGVMAIGVLAGIGLGIVLALLILIRHVSAPPTAILGQVPGKEAFRSIYRRSDLETFDGLLIFRFDAGLFFANANYFASNLKVLIAQENKPVHWVLVDAATINMMDSTAVERLVELQASLKQQGILMAFAHVRDQVKDKMILAGLVDKVGEAYFFETISDGVSSFQNNTKEKDF